MQHSLLNKQIQRLGLSEELPPATQESWRQFLEKVDATYSAADQDRYLLERSLSLSSAEMQESQRRADTIIDSALDAVVTMDGEGIITGWNHQAEATFGWSAAEVIGRVLADTIIPAPLRAAHLDGVTRYLATGTGPIIGRRTEVTALHRGGTEFPVELAIQPLRIGERTLFSAFVRDISQRKSAEAEIAAARAIMDTVSRSLLRFVGGTPIRDVMEDILGDVLSLTESEYGFVAEHVIGARGQPCLKAYAISNIAWDEATRDFFDTNAPAGLEFDNFNTLFGAAVTSRRPVLSNDPMNDPRRGGLPQGHPPLRAFLSIPFLLGDEVVGTIGIANRPNGYSEAQIELLHPLAVTCSSLIDAHRNEQRQRQAEQQLKEYSAVLEETNRTLAGLNQSLAEAKAAAEGATRAKSEFLANTSHEIRTPMTAIVGFTQFLREHLEPSTTSAECMEALDTIERNADHLVTVINDILDLSKIEAGKMAIERMDCPLREIVTEVAALMKPRAAAKQLDFDWNIAANVPERIATDPVRLRQVLINLAGNAIKFTSQGRVRLDVCCAGSDGSRIQFDVVDTGIGMTIEQVGRLFKPFTQADTSMARRFGGTGLGLVLSRRLAQMLGGDVCVVDSALGVGTRLRATIAAVAPKTEEPSGRSSDAPESIASDQPIACRVLLAEDAPDNQKLITFILRKAGAVVTLVDNGQLAVDAALDAERQGQAFDLIFMDMQMPVMDGYTAVRTLRERSYLGPIVALTAHAMIGDREKCLAAGCDDYATKPIDRGKIHQLLRLYSQCSRSEFPDGRADAELPVHGSRTGRGPRADVTTTVT